MFLNCCAKYTLTINKPPNSGMQNICKSIVTQIKRTFFGDNNKQNSSLKKYKDKKIVGYSPQQMYNVISDVGNYKHFIPFCKESHISIEEPGFKRITLVIGFPPIVEKYTSNVTLQEPYFVRSRCIEGKIFDHLDTTWKLSPALKNNPKTCIIDFDVSFEFRSLLHSQLANLFFDRMVRQMETAFINEARVRYGEESLPPTSLDNLPKS